MTLPESRKPAASTTVGAGGGVDDFGGVADDEIAEGVALLKDKESEMIDELELDGGGGGGCADGDDMLGATSTLR